MTTETNNNNNNNQPEIHPLLRERLQIKMDGNFPKLKISPDEKTMIMAATGPCSPELREQIHPMVMEAMDIVCSHNQALVKHSPQWLVTCLGLMSRYNKMGYIDFERIN